MQRGEQRSGAGRSGRWGAALTALVALSLSSGCASQGDAPQPASTAAAKASPEPVPKATTEADADGKRAPAKEKRDASARSEEAAPSPPAASTEVGSGESAKDGFAAPGGPAANRGPASGATPLAAVAVVTGGRVTREVIAQVLGDNLERFRPCATSDAKVELRLTLGPAGSVAAAESPRSQPDEPRLRDCVVDAARALRFPRDPGSDTSVVSFELVLTRPPF
jgi:hypothetical protein